MCWNGCNERNSLGKGIEGSTELEIVAGFVVVSIERALGDESWAEAGVGVKAYAQGRSHLGTSEHYTHCYSFLRRCYWHQVSKMNRQLLPGRNLKHH
jgi:hypothetical protein